MQRHPAHARLGRLVGDWTWQATRNGEPYATGNTRTEWIEDGAYLKQYSTGGDEWGDKSPHPATVIIGFDDYSETFSYAYTDARGVCRVHEMTLSDDHFTVAGRPGETFHQRGAFDISDDVISGYYEHSQDGVTWERDFDMQYTRIPA
jgi:hypothetical protein